MTRRYQYICINNEIARRRVQRNQLVQQMSRSCVCTIRQSTICLHNKRRISWTAHRLSDFIERFFFHTIMNVGYGWILRHKTEQHYVCRCWNTSLYIKMIVAAKNRPLTLLSLGENAHNKHTTGKCSLSVSSFLCVRANKLSALKFLAL
jgi:hypothetical protein